MASEKPRASANPMPMLFPDLEAAFDCVNGDDETLDCRSVADGTSVTVSARTPVVPLESIDVGVESPPDCVDRSLPEPAVSKPDEKPGPRPGSLESGVASEIMLVAADAGTLSFVLSFA